MSPDAPPPQFPTPQPRRLVRWALFFPAALMAWVLWQLLLARLFYGGVFQAGLTWVEGTAEAVFVLIAAIVAPAHKRRIATIALGFFVCRDIATVLLAPSAGMISDAIVAIALAGMGTAIVWWHARS